MFARPVLIGLAAASIMLSSGCRSDKPEGEPINSPPASPSSSPSPGPGAEAEREALAAYGGMWSAFVTAAKTSDPDDPSLRDYATGKALKLIVGGLVTNQTQGKIVLGDLKNLPRVTRLTPSDKPTTAEITDCVDATNWLEYKKSRVRWDDKPGGKHLTTATVQMVDGTWKVASFTLRKIGTC